ncbi:hypothetical protein TEQG_04465 [Trichophyton equinum CBS 127.97]|uniref:NAD(P)-binding domain-containing protein n=1 Tax=Trichophyton equinum (strain ATCC MYA-4606 / CBS 127.97) TaxID=559882 RepID=F2PTU2_TRIEC|nr:hypothetical protein TEQG_04465 [Trichophyton equinum CBS 127.97]
MAIAIAGMGPVGETIMDTLLEIPEYQKQVVILTRKKEARDSFNQVEQVEVDYNDISSLAASLEKHNIDTVICAIGMISPEAGQSQVNLIQAAEKSSVTKRFIPSEYSFVQSEEILHLTPEVNLYIAANNALKETRLKYTRIFPGYFMDYWGMPNVRTRLKPLAYAVDIPNRRAIIPGDGTKFEVSYDPLEKVKNNESTPLPQSDKVVYPPEIVSWVVSYMSQVAIVDGFKMPKDKRINNMFPDVKPVNMREFLTNAWKA